MFGKLLKYDFKSIARYFWIIALSVLGASVVGGVAMRFFNEMSSAGESVPTFARILMIGAMLLYIICFVGVVASIAVTEILLISRFYKNFFTDEGYLTFTLPVTRRQHLRSKFINAIIWLFLHILLLIVGFVILTLIGTFGTTVDPSISHSLVSDSVNSDASSLGILDQASPIWILLLFLVELPLFFLTTIAFAVTMLYFCFTLGSIYAKKAKVMASIGIYYLVNSVLSTIFTFVLLFGIVSLALDLPILLSQATPDTICAVIALLVLVCTAAIATLAMLFYNITLGKLERKLNLA